MKDDRTGLDVAGVAALAGLDAPQCGAGHWRDRTRTARARCASGRWRQGGSVIRVTFADGYEDREDDSPCIANVFEPVLRHPSEDRWYLWFPDANPPFSFCARNVIRLSDWRGGGALVWRITSAKGEPLAGQWAECHVESYPEQIARLEGEVERVEAHREATLASLRQTSDRVCEEKARGDAAEQRLADLRAWAVEIAEGQRDSPEGRRVAGDFRAVVYRIDGEDGESK